jgi:predicted TIM-barrel fold metal-dependent hydrolase
VFEIDRLMRPWLDRIVQDTGPLDLYDAHMHVGQHDPDGYKQTPSELLEALASCDARGVVFPMHEPDGYRAANDAVIAFAAEHADRVVCFCRVSPHDDAVTEARRALDAGARGIKLHPRAEQFGMDEPAVEALVELAGERGVPVLIHAGRGIPALGQNTVRLAEANPGATLILAHAAISDLAWLWRVLPDHPNVLVDTAWWNPVDLVALFALAPPANIVWASDSPYGRPIMSAVMGMRCALQAGLGNEQIHAIAGGTLERVLAGSPPADLGPPPGQPEKSLDLLLERCHSHLAAAFSRFIAGGSPTESIGLARLSCAVGTDSPHADLFGAVLAQLDAFEADWVPTEFGRPFPLALRHLVHAIVVARTPDVPLPAERLTAAPTWEHADE